MCTNNRSRRPIIVIVVTLGIVGCAVVTATLPSRADRASLAPQGANAAWQRVASEQLAHAEYAATFTAAGLQAPNRAHDLRTTFGDRGIEVVPRVQREAAPAWRFTWETVAVGRTASRNDLTPVVPESDGTRVSYRHAGWSEWYDNTPHGLEQGFTIEDRPAGGGPLRISGRYPESLRAESRVDGSIDFIDENGACVLRYGELHAWDARGDSLDSEMVLMGNELALLIQDEDAAYPLTIDPILTSPVWTAEPNQANALFGFSVGTAGDVNGDGYSDVIVGAWGFDSGETDEGRALVYLGSPSGLSVSPSWTAESNQAGALFGYAVATAGDVNGDGFDDVLVGAFQHDGGQTNEGRAFLYHGSAGGLGTNPSWTAECDQANAQFGTSVASAGDVHADGFDEVIIGAPFFGNDQSTEGRAFVYAGSAAGLSSTPVWTGEGNQNGAQFGVSTATAGDVNGDGFADVIIGAWVYANGQANEGRAFVFHGAAGGLSTSANWTAESNQANSYFGISVAGAGDVNGDGFGDVVIGAQGYSNGQSSEGRAYVYHGAAGGLASAAAWTSEPNLGDASFGHCVASAGDVNGDGFADVIIGAMNLTNGHAAEGRAYLYSGSRNGLWSFTDWTAEGNQTNANFAISVATAGDVNGDGHSDLLVGAWTYDNGQSDEGRAFVYYGAADGVAGLLQWAVESPQSSSNHGCSVASAGDVNGDGYSDAIIGASHYDNGQADEGRAFVYHGSATGLSFTPAWIAEGDQAQAYFGSWVSSAGDVNGDGYSDVVIGAPAFDAGQPEEGRAFVYHGSPSGLGATPARILESNEHDRYLGSCVACAGDVNGDGFSDVMVGAPGDLFAAQPFGRVYVYAGSANGLGSAPIWTADADISYTNFGRSVASAGDVNGDGFSDIAAGIFGHGNGPESVGRAFVWYGSANGPSLTPDWIGTDAQEDDQFGSCVASAGDVNGDGYSDLAVGAPVHSVPGQIVGRALVYHGSASGLSIANWSVDGDVGGCQLGYSVATAGDVNGDGFSDLIVGAPQYSNVYISQGRVLVYHGSSLGLAFAPARLLELFQEHARYGFAVAPAGDVNGDGFSDVLVSAINYFDDFGFGLVSSNYGNGNRGLDRIPQQVRTIGSAPISPLGRSDSPSAFLLNALGRTAAGRDDVRLELEVKPYGVPFNGSGLTIGSKIDTGVPSSGIGSAVPISQLASGLTADRLYHWRVRMTTDSPFFPRTPWMFQPDNGAGEADLRTAPPASDVADFPVPRALRIESVCSNPIVRSGEINFTLPEAADARLCVYDVSGRLRLVLDEGRRAAGLHSLRWDGRDRSGTRLPAGVYLLRLESNGQQASTKLVLAR